MEIDIKEEPVDDYYENTQEMFNKLQCQEEEAAATSLLKQQLQMAFIKDEPLDNSDIFTVVEEHDQFITVSAADMKTQDELQFIKKLQKPQNSISDCCAKCLKQFTKHSSYLEHTKRNNCIVKHKCSACPLTFIELQSLLKHLTLHRDNKFFCSQNCGEHFDNLPLCEDHEKRVHKMTNPPKIRYKHFCSYCREGFKTELQLHVHWLQKDIKCGKLLHDVATQYAIASNLFNKTDKTTNQTESKKLSPPPTFPLTKLRLKSNMPPPLTTIKRPSEEPIASEVKNEAKRSKCVNNLKTLMNSKPNEMLADSEIEIKQEPMNDSEDQEHDVMNTAPMTPEVIIKTEDEKQGKPGHLEGNPNIAKDELTNSKGLKSLFINDNKEMNPEFHGKIIQMMAPSKKLQVPMLPKINNNNSANIINMDQMNNNLNILENDANNNISSINGNNNSLKNLTNLKLFRLTPSHMQPANIILPPNIQLIPLQKPLQQQQQQQTMGDFKIIPAPKMSLQILKLMPASQLPNNTNNNLLFQHPLNVVKISNSPLVVSQQSLQNHVQPQQNHVQSQQNNIQFIMPPVSSNDTTTVTTAKTITTQNLAIEPNNHLNNLNVPINAADTTQTKEERIQYIPKSKLIAIESIPEKKQLIDTMKQQIAKVAVGDTSLTDSEKQKAPLMIISKDIESSMKAPGTPPTLYLPMLTTIDVELVKERYKYPDYKYKWICPYCLKDYDIKRCLKSHLTKAHNLTTRDMDKINVQAKPFKNEETTIDIETTTQKPQQQQNLYNNVTLKIKLEPEHNHPINTTVSSEGESQPDDSESTTPPSQPIKMSALNIVKARYICEKCGRKCSSKTMLNDHISANCSREPQYSCKECPKKFYSLSTLQCHITIHTGDLPHKCNYCDKRFRTRGQVTVHHRTHTGERPFVCQVGVFPALYTP
ncbi:uncharacterized protein isoform X2 [Musca autumnalis]|uniref:uncharacterized protein isoform X2 n=1 Tax=Musca autumnalis TaxID=221902 RepID=UPI003CFA3E3D